MDYYEILGVPRTCDKKGVHQAFRTLSKTKHPDCVPENLRFQAEKDFQLVVRAFNTLKSPDLRTRYDKTLAHKREEITDPVQKAAVYFKRGMNYYEKKQYPEAAESFNKAVFFKETPEYLYHRGLAQLKVPREKKAGVGSLQRAVQLDSDNLVYLKTLAEAFMDYGLKSRAHMVVEKMLEMAPDDADAQRLGVELGITKSGFFGGLFGKGKGD